MAEPLAVRLGRVIRDERRRRCLTQKEVVESLGRTQSWLSRVETGITEPTLDDLDALLRRLDMTLSVEVNQR